MILIAAATALAAPEQLLPLFFLPIAEQSDAPIRFAAQTPNLQVGLAADFIILRGTGMQVRMRFVDANSSVAMEGVDALPARANFFSGRNAENWRADVPIYQKVLYRSLYAGIDMTYGEDGARIKSEFLLAPGADPDQIRIEYQDAIRVSIAENGDLVVVTEGGELREQAPAIYQDSGSRRTRVNGGYRMLGPRMVGFELGGYDTSKPLLIDPVVSYCTYLGGSGMGAVTGVAVDSSGNLYVTGWTEALNFPIAGAVQANNRGGVDAFVVKMNAAGTQLLYASYIGGLGDDRAAGIAVDSLGQAYVAGSTSSTNFPLAAPIRSTLGGGRDAFALKLSAAGNALLYSTYLGGSNYDLGNAIAVDGSGNAYIAGDTLSADFPVLNAVQQFAGGSMDAFITKLTPSGAIAFSTFLGGAGNDHAGGIAVDSSGNVYVGGGTFSTNFPVVNALQSSNGGGQDAFATKLSANGATLIYSTYLGGTGGSQGMPEEANSIAVDASGNAYLVGATSSVNFPLTSGALRSNYNATQDAFAVKINAAGSALTYGTYLGGASMNWASGVALDSQANAYISGYTSSFDFPTVGAAQTTFSGLQDAFIAELNGAGNSLNYSTFYGGSMSSSANAIAIDSNGNIYTGGQTNSTDLKLVAPIQSVNSGGSTGWVMRVGGSAQGSSGTAQFVKVDTTSQGTWKGVYGADGYNVIGNAPSYPAYVTPAASGNSGYTWAANTPDVRALQQAGSGRIAATWYTYNQFTIDLPFSGSGTYQMAVYCVDWDNLARAQTLQILDINNNVLDTRAVSNFSGGIWVVWNLSGHVQLRVTVTGGINAVISGIFFGL